MTYTAVKQEKRHRFKPGESGNPKGRPRKPEAEILRNALEQAKKEKGLHLIEDAVLKAYDDTALKIAILKKILPDRVSSELTDSRILLIRYERTESDRDSTRSQNNLQTKEVSG